MSVLWLALWLPATACAQAEAGLDLVWASEGGASESWSRRVARRLEDEGLDVRRTDDWTRELPPDHRAAHEALVRTERALEGAREAMQTLDEARASALLASAHREVTSALALPGAVAWAAEVELALGRLAAQAGERSLARASFERAFVLAPARALGAAEAPPDVVAMAEEVLRSVRARPNGRIPLEVVWPSRALVYLDDQLVGAAPRPIDARVGSHVLRIEAEGAESYVARIDVLAGARPAMTVALSPTPAVDAIERGHAAFARGDDEALRAAIAVLGASVGEPVRVWLVEGGSGPFERALVTPCDAERCTGPMRLETDTRESPLAALEAGPVRSRARREALAWRDEVIVADVEPPPPPYDPWAEGWPWALVGTGAALVVGAAIAGIVVAAQPPPDHVLSVEPTWPPGVFTP
ncbi:MAG: PEGA domain-containing protein [Sandaracinus sp.]